jgi:hypothetical protein
MQSLVVRKEKGHGITQLLDGLAQHRMSSFKLGRYGYFEWNLWIY